MSVFKFYYEDRAQVALLLECSVGYLELRRLKLKYIWQLTPCLLQIIDAGCFTGSTNSIKTVVEVALGKTNGILLNTSEIQLMTLV